MCSRSPASPNRSRPSARASRCAASGSLASFCSPAWRLLQHVGKQGEETGTLDGAREFTLLLRGHRGDAARHDLAALRNEALQQPRVLVVDLRRLRPGEGAALAAGYERARATAAAGHDLDAHPPASP